MKSVASGIDFMNYGVVFNDGEGGAGAGEGVEGDGIGEGASGSWLDSITDETLKPIASRYNSPADVVKAVSDLRKQLSTSIRVPGDGATEEEVAKYRKALGVPADIKGYEFKMPDGHEATDADLAFQSKVAEIMHESGVPVSTATKLVDLWNNLTVESEEALRANDARVVEATTKELKTKWGADFERNKNLAGRAAKHVAGDKFDSLATLELKDGTLFLDTPLAMEMLAKIGAELDEGGFERYDPASVSSIQDEIRETREARDRAHSHGDMKKAMEFDEKERELYRKLGNSAGVVGSGGRSV